MLDLEHHANLLPWIGSDARVVTAADTIAEDARAGGCRARTRHRALVTVTGASNVTGEVLPLRELATIAHRHGTRLAVDGASWFRIAASTSSRQGIDYLAFSGHKLYAPFGAGVLVGRSDWLDAGAPYLRGGERSSRSRSRRPRGAAVRATRGRLAERARRRGPRAGGRRDLLAGRGVVDRSGDALRRRLVGGARGRPGRARAPGLHRFIRSGRRGFLSLDGVESGLLASYLSAEWAVGVRHGQFCAHPLLARLGITGPALRASFGVGGPRTRTWTGCSRDSRPGPPRVHDCATRSSTARGLSPTMHGRCQTGRPRRAPQRASYGCAA
ncbi:MAG: aminotransferase class V-fold PLP-dependent enzyme [Galbitalea sp.]